MSGTPTGEQWASGRAARRRRARRKVGAGAALAAALGIGGGWLWLGTVSPLVTVMSPSMAPALEVGEIALMGAVRGAPEVGDVVEVPVPVEVQRERNYPRTVVHRIVDIDDGMVTTQGDSLDEPDPFEVPIEDIDRRLVTVVPGAGRLVSFLFSPFGLLWIGSGVVLFVVYPMIERSRERHEVEQVETKQTLQHVVAAVADYGYHLKSHTEILKAMSRAAQDLSAVVSRLEGRVEPGDVVLGPALASRPRPVRTRPLVAPTRQVPAARRTLHTPAAARPPVRTRPLVAARRPSTPRPHPPRTRPLVATTRTTRPRPVPIAPPPLAATPANWRRSLDP